jgi:hypothetical protein
MTDETHNPPSGEDIGFERRDLNPMVIVASLAGLALLGILIYFVIWGVYAYMNHYEKTQESTLSPLVKPELDTRAVTPADVAKFPQPRLETNERIEINGFRLKEEQELHSYGWVDQNAGIVHIPIDRAMQLLAQQGLPTRPQTGTVPASPVNLARQAAHASDTSREQNNQPQKQRKETKKK